MSNTANIIPSAGQEPFDPSKVKKLSLLEILKKIGPGIIMTGVAIGPGNITTSAMLGANYGYTMIWLVIPIMFMGVTFMLASYRIAMLTGMLDKKTRELLTVVCLTAMQTLPQLKAHVKAALNVGNSPLAVREAVYQCAPIIGFPRTLNAVGVADEVFLENGISLPLPAQGTVDEAKRYEKGLALQFPLYGDEIKDKYADLPDGIGEALPRFLTEVCFGDFYTRGVLNVQERELLVLTVLASLGADVQIKAHAIGNLRAGNSKEMMYAAMVQCLPYIGFPAAFHAINIIKSVE